MVKAKHIIFGAAILAGGILATIIFFKSEEAKIRKQFEFIAEKIEKRPGENPITAAGKAYQIREVFAEECRIDPFPYALPRAIPSDELPGIVLRVRAEYSTIALTFHDFVIEISEQNTAQVHVTVIIEGGTTNGESVEDLHELSCHLKKIEKTWRFKEIGFVEVLKK